MLFNLNSGKGLLGKTSQNIAAITPQKPSFAPPPSAVAQQPATKARYKVDDPGVDPGVKHFSDMGGGLLLSLMGKKINTPDDLENLEPGLQKIADNGRQFAAALMGFDHNPAARRDDAAYQAERSELFNQMRAQPAASRYQDTNDLAGRYQ